MKFHSFTKNERICESVIRYGILLGYGRDKIPRFIRLEKPFINVEECLLGSCRYCFVWVKTVFQILRNTNNYLGRIIRLVTCASAQCNSRYQCHTQSKC